MKKAYAAAPENADLAARLAERYLGIGDTDETASHAPILGAEVRCSVAQTSTAPRGG